MREVDDVGQIAGLSAGERDDLRARALSAVNGSVIPGYQALLGQLRNLMGSAPATVGVRQYPRGREYYTYSLRHHSTTNLTAAVTSSIAARASATVTGISLPSASARWNAAN